jgi:hypothetical protein
VAAEVVRAGIRFELYSRVRPSEMASELQMTARTVGGGFCRVIMSTFMGGYFAKGA